MTLLKGDKTTPIKTDKIDIISWPSERNGIGLNINDGWYFGIGLGLALTIAVPIILLIISFIVGIILVVAGAL